MFSIPQFSGLFSKGSSTVVSMLSGSFDASSGVMLIVKVRGRLISSWYFVKPIMIVLLSKMKERAFRLSRSVRKGINVNLGICT